MTRCAFIWAAALTVALPVTATADDKPPPPAPALRDLLKEADELEKKRIEVGAALLKRATEDKLSEEEAEDTMVALGKLKYAPAVDHVLSRLTVSRAARKSEIISRVRGTSHLFPAIASAWDLGPITVKPLVKMYRERFAELEKAKKSPKDDWLLGHIAYTLMRPPLAATAAGYLDKLLEYEWQTGIRDEEFQALQDLLKYIREEGKGR
jgi:hypothetical protein